MKQLRFVIHLENEAMDRSGKHTTGIVSFGDITLHYYPVCKRFTWFHNGQPIAKEKAVRWLTEKINYKAGMLI